MPQASRLFSRYQSHAPGTWASNPSPGPRPCCSHQFHTRDIKSIPQASNPCPGQLVWQRRLPNCCLVPPEHQRYLPSSLLAIKGVGGRREACTICTILVVDKILHHFPPIPTSPPPPKNDKQTTKLPTNATPHPARAPAARRSVVVV